METFKPVEKPPVDLPTPDSSTLGKAPLELVVFQIRHEATESVGEPDTALRLSRILTHRYPALERVSQADLIVQMGPGGAEASGQMTHPAGWKLTSEDGKWIVQVLPDSAALECTGYTTWTDFEERVQELLLAVESIVAPQLVQRIGLRYVDRIITGAGGRPASWLDEGLLEPYLLTFANDDVLRESVLAAQTMSHLKLNGVHVLFRSSCAPDAKSRTGFSTVLDTDCFDPDVRAFEVPEVVSVAQELHLRSLQMFQRATADKLRVSLGA